MDMTLSPNSLYKARTRNYGLDFSLLIILISLLIRFWVIGAHNLFVEEAYYWNYSQHLDFSYLDHPPMVALLIKASTILFGTYEYSVRIPAILCWVIATIFCFKLSELIYRGSGLCAILLLSSMPFYFIQSTLLTPDQPLLACWSALLYYFYRALILDDSKAWYKSGVWLGLGMLSKYSIVLLGPAVLLYLVTIPSARFWFSRKEPYLCVFIALCIFSPVIYWNAIHDWASFAFQSTRRFKSAYKFNFHYFIGLVILYLLPGGLFGLFLLFQKKYATLDEKIRWYLQIFILFPLAFFGIYSFSHSIKMDWIGPGLVSTIPWLAMLLTKNSKFLKAWQLHSLFLLPLYLGLIGMIALGPSEKASQLFFRKHISWEILTLQFNELGDNVVNRYNQHPIFAPLDDYNIGSELAFYQKKLFEQGKTNDIYPILGRHVWGKESLMYKYWSNDYDLSGKILILITKYKDDFQMTSIKSKTIALSPPKTIWSHSQGRGLSIEPYYYQIVQVL